jgi:hypothetical protein
MTVQEIKTLPTREKFQLMETLWEDLKDHYEAFECSPELRLLLDERRARVLRGEAGLVDWDEVKSTIGRA